MYESDGLNVLEGILNVVRDGCGEDFLWALPSSFLSQALTWFHMPHVFGRCIKRK